MNNADVYASPDRRHQNYGDFVRNSHERPYSRQGANQSLAQDFFGMDIPDPNAIKNNTRDTLTIRDVLQPNKPVHRPT